jgi:LysR family nitrogen assimilation transcriptional regulator
MNLKQLEYFVAIAEHGSFSKAATMLDVAQPALSRQIRSLEEELKQALFVRTGRGVALTDAGQRLFDQGLGILQLVAEARETVGAVRDEPVGRVTIGLPPSFGRLLTLPLIDRFKSELPGARLAIVEGLSTHILEWINSGRVDAALVYNPDAQPGIAITPLREEPLGLVSAGPRRKRPPKPLPLAELPRYPLILPERVHAMRRLLETRAALAGIKLDIAWEVSSIPSIIDLVRAGYGHAVLTGSAIAALADAEQLVLRPLVEPAITNVACLVTSGLKRPTPLVQYSMRLLTEVLRAQLR